MMFGGNFTGEKRIDFKKPPEGKKYVPLPTNDDDIDLRWAEISLVVIPLAYMDSTWSSMDEISVWFFLTI